MSDKSSKGFDPSWYAAQYPDVGLSGLSPREHYRRFGKLMGRDPNGAALAAPSPVKKKTIQVNVRSMPPELSAEPTSTPATLVEAAPIIDRPEGLDVSADGSGAAERIAASPLGLLDGADGETALKALARLLRVDRDCDAGEPAQLLSCNSVPLQSGVSRIESAWYAGRSRLRLMIAGNVEAGPSTERAVLRCYQPDLDNPLELLPAGDGVRLRLIGPAFHDVELHHPLMPIVLELSGGEGTYRSFTLIPFPSLLPGGLHWAELKATQTEADPMDDFWAWSETLLKKALARPQRPQSSIRRIGTGTGSAGGAKDVRADVESWLSKLFGLELNVETSSGIELALPPDCVPTIGALVSSDLDVGKLGHRIGPYLVAEAESFRPRWSIVLPQTQQPWAGAATLRGPAAKRRATGPVSLHLAIALRSRPTERPQASDNREAGASTPSFGLPLSVIIHASDAERTSRLVDALQDKIGESAEFLILASDNGVRAQVESACAKSPLTLANVGSDIRDIARIARHDLLLSVSDRVRLDDPNALAVLMEMLRDESIASASCLLLGEKVLKRQAVLQVGSGGLFPSGVSFAAAPRMSFVEPDAADALPGLTYPVAANTLLLTLFRRKALADLETPTTPVPPTSADIRIGLDLMRAGYSSWCTTRAMAVVTGGHSRRDVIDPVGGDYAAPDRWAEILSKVTLARELF